MAEIIENFDVNQAQKIEAPDTTKIKEFLEQEIQGQLEAVEFWANVIHRALSNVPKLRNGPLAVATEIGPSGVGKTEIVKRAAEYLASQSYQNKQVVGTKTEKPTVLRIDCGEYQQEHEVSKVIGSPPGYTGYGETPRLGQSEVDKHAIAVTPKKSVTILLLDEIEKAHPNLNLTLLGGLDYGVITLGNNSKTDLRNCIVVFTSNLGNKEIAAVEEGGKSLTMEDKNKMRMEAMRRHFSPEQISRMGGETSTIVFNELSREVVTKILVGKLGKLEKLYAEQNVNIDFQLTQTGLEKLLELGYSNREGIRRLEAVLEQEIVTKLTTLPKTKSKITIVLDATEGSVSLYVPKAPETQPQQAIKPVELVKSTSPSEAPTETIFTPQLQPVEAKEANGENAQALLDGYHSLVEKMGEIAAKSNAGYPGLAQARIKEGKEHKLTYQLQEDFQKAAKKGLSDISEQEAQTTLLFYMNQMCQMLSTNTQHKLGISDYDRKKELGRIFYYTRKAVEDGDYSDLLELFKKTFKVIG